LLHDGAAFLRPEGVVDGHYFVLFYFHYCLITKIVSMCWTPCGVFSF
jgi:hypothetical protein